VGLENQKAPAAKVFVLCTTRSGSTLLRYIIDTHPRICCPPELRLGPTADTLYWSTLYSVAQVRSPDENERHRIAVSEVRRVLDGLMCTYAQLKQKEFWCEKTPRNLGHLKLLNEVFPDAHFICLYRNCMDMVHSVIEGNRYGKMGELWDLNRVFEIWIEQVSSILKFERENPERCFRVKYEELVLDSPRVLSGLFGFLGLEWDEKLIDQVFAVQHDVGAGDPKVAFSSRIYQHSIGKGAAIKLETVPRPLLTKINALLRELDYPEVGPNWNNQPSPYLPAGVVTGSAGQLSHVKEVITDYFPHRLGMHEESLSRLNGILKLVVKGDDGGVWKLDLNHKPARLFAEDGSADCTITVVSSDLLKIANRELNAGECFLQARLRVAGDELLAYKLGQILFGA
jgi:putative sterol carrier protein